MTAASVKREAQAFLRDREPSVLAITGPWGVGKTYLWHALMAEFANTPNDLPRNTYAYVSLFGIESLSQLKLSIFENTARTTALANSDPDTVMAIKNAESLFNSLDEQHQPSDDTRAWPNWLLNLNPLSPKTAVRATQVLDRYLRGAELVGMDLAFHSVRDRLICLDDIERRGSALRLMDVLGLVSLLREQRKCKVVLLFNEDELGKSDRKKLHAQREKVVDVTLQLMPTPAEAVELVFGEIPIKRRLQKLCQTLEVRNLRVLQKIRRQFDRVQPVLDEYWEHVSDQILSSLALFTVSHYIMPDGVPPFSFFRKQSSASAAFEEGFFAAEERENDVERMQEQKWKEFLRQYGYMYTDELDFELMEYVETGILNEERIRALAAELYGEAEKARRIKRYRSAWNPYRNTFEDNEDQFVNVLVERGLETIDLFGIGDCNSIVSILRDLGREEEATKMCRTYVKTHRENRTRLNVDAAHLHSKLDDEFRQILAEAYQVVEAKPSLAEALQRIGTEEQKSRDLEVAVEASEEQFFELFQSESGDQLLDIVRGALFYARVVNANPSQQEMVERAKQALRRIGRLSQLNRVRVENIYGINGV